ncbi:MAG TPA: hypothetical protein P5567_08335 [Kiritimatiellia bacterium]|nr:hypothetical protein [Kiritimatiellia bacterium]HRZ12448.1 hypothetical protein [Kiritimatiellia bacterium]HSA17794.1 hypothetical protein [Kiritimatiellia bacterium]
MTWEQAVVAMIVAGAAVALARAGWRSAARRRESAARCAACACPLSRPGGRCALPDRGPECPP